MRVDFLSQEITCSDFKKNKFMKKTVLLGISFVFLITLNAQEVKNDTLFFKLDGKYVFESKHVSNSYLLKDSNDVDRGTFF